MQSRISLGVIAAVGLFSAGGCSSDPESTLGVISGVGGNSTAAAATTQGAASSAAPPATIPTTPWVAEACPAFGVSPVDSTPMILATEANNYSFTSTLALQNDTLKSSSDLTFDWSAVTKDFLEHPLAPADVQMVVLALFPYSAEVIAQKMNEDTLVQNDARQFAMLYPNGASQDTLFNAYLDTNKLKVDEILPIFNADPVEGWDPALYTFTAILQASREPTKEVRMMKTFKLDPNSTNTTLTLDNDSATLAHWEAKMQQAQVTVMPPLTPGITIDWTDSIQTNGLGRPFKDFKIREAFVAHYADKTVPDLEQEFLFLEDIATEQWRAPIDAGESVNLSTMLDADGAGFPGIDESGTWVLGLICSTCSNPAPWYITVLKTCTQ